MRKVIIILLLCIPVAANAANYYVATNGNDNNPGTLSQPWATWQKGFNSISAGDILFIRGGTYTQMKGLYGGNYYGVRVSNRDGSADNLITVSAYNNEIPILDCSSLSTYAGFHRGIEMDYCDYWHIKGLTVKNVREYASSPTSYSGGAWEFSGCSHITAELCTVTRCMNGFSLSALNKDITYLNCDSYENWDIYQRGDLCNGFNGNTKAGSTIKYIGCRAWLNSDDGYDNFGGGGYMTYTSCWALNNKPWHGGDEEGNGDGFKLGYSNKTAETGDQRILYNCISANNGLMGFDESMDVGTAQNMALYNCVSYNNSDYFSFRFDQIAGSNVTTLRNNISIGTRNLYSGRARNISDHNSWDGGVVANSSDFVSTDWTQLLRPRKADGSLPDITAFHLVAGSDLIDKGVNAGLPFSGIAPDLGAFEQQASPTAEASAPAITMTIAPNPVHRFINIIFAYTTTFSKQDPSVSPQIIRILDVSGKLFIEKILVTGIESIKFPINLRSGIYTVMVLSGGINISSQKLLVYR